MPPRSAASVAETGPLPGLARRPRQARPAFCRLIILSNVDRSSFAGSNARLGVTFTSILTAEDIGSYKPSSRNFDALAEGARRLGVDPGKLLHVAQSLFHDHLPAKACRTSHRVDQPPT